MRAAAVVIFVLVARTATAGPWCGGYAQFAPADETVLPESPTIAQNVSDRYYGGSRDSKASTARLRATIDGTRVKITTKDVRTQEGVIRFIKIASKRTGTLELWEIGRYHDKEPQLVAHYTIAADAPTVDAIAVTVAHGEDTRLHPYHRVGQLVVIQTDAPAIAFTLEWRRDKDDAWRTRTLEAWIRWEDYSKVYDPKEHPSEAHLGGSMCGMVENVPVALLKAGIEAQMTAMLPDGRQMVLDLPNPLVMPFPDSSELGP